MSFRWDSVGFYGFPLILIRLRSSLYGFAGLCEWVFMSLCEIWWSWTSFQQLSVGLWSFSLFPLKLWGHLIGSKVFFFEALWIFESSFCFFHLPWLREIQMSMWLFPGTLTSTEALSQSLRSFVDPALCGISLWFSVEAVPFEILSGVSMGSVLCEVI